MFYIRQWLIAKSLKKINTFKFISFRLKVDFLKSGITPTKAIVLCLWPILLQKLGLYDARGQLVASHSLNSKGIIELDTKRLVAGVYLLQILVEGKTIAESKLVVLE